MPSSMTSATATAIRTRPERTKSFASRPPGKSTLLNIVGLLDRPTAGRLTIKGQAQQRSETPKSPICAATHRLRVSVSPLDLSIHGEGKRDDADACGSRRSERGDRAARIESVGSGLDGNIRRPSIYQHLGQSTTT